MNKARRKKINETAKRIDFFVSSIKSEVENILADEEFAYDSMPENLQYSMRGMNSEEAIDLLNETLEKLDEVTDLLSSII